MSPASEELADLLAHVAGSDRRAFARLYKATSAKLFGVAVHVLNDSSDAEDALQDTYISVWANASHYDRRTYSPITWLVVIARNRSIDRLRKRSGSPAESIDDFPDLQGVQETPEEAASTSEVSRHIDAAILELKSRSGAMVRDAYLEGHSYLELSAIYDMPLNTVRSVLRRSLMAMRGGVAMSAHRQPSGGRSTFDQVRPVHLIDPAVIGTNRQGPAPRGTADV